MNGAAWLLEALAAEGVRYLFGNPGSTELPLIEALGHQNRIEYVLCLHEAAALGMADGYAQATGEMAAVNVHVQPGMANALSGILNARRARVPMLVTVGQQVTGLLEHSPFLGGEIVGLAKPLSKAGWEPTTANELARDFRCAVDATRAAPMGPVVLSIPLDVQAGDAPTAHQPTPPPSLAEIPDGPIAEAGARIDASTNPAILVGDGLVHAGGEAALVRLSELLDAPIFGEPYAARAPLSTDHPLWRGPLPGFAAEIRPLLEDHDLLLAVGMPVFRLFGTSPGPALTPGQTLIHIDVDPDELGRSHAPQVALCADPRRAVEMLATSLAPRQRTTVTPRLPSPTPGPGEGISPVVLADAIAKIVGADDVVVDEALTAGRGLRGALVPRTPANWFAHRGSALGWGLPAGVGIAMARPDQRVLVVHGDGSALFGLSALWTTAHRRERVAVVIADNHGYEILRAGMEGLTGERDGVWPGLALTDPPLDLEALCRGYGASVEVESTAAGLHDGLSRLWSRAQSGPAVLIACMTGLTPAVGYPIAG